MVTKGIQTWIPSQWTCAGSQGTTLDAWPPSEVAIFAYKSGWFGVFVDQDLWPFGADRFSDQRPFRSWQEDSRWWNAVANWCVLSSELPACNRANNYQKKLKAYRLVCIYGELDQAEPIQDKKIDWLNRKHAFEGRLKYPRNVTILGGYYTEIASWTNLP